MSVEIMSEVWQMGLSGNDLLVALCLADRADSDTRRCWPGIPYIAKRGGMSERTAQGAVRRLVEIGVLTRQERSGTSSVYTFRTPADIAPPQNLRPAEVAPPPPQNLPVTPAESAPNTSRNTNGIHTSPDGEGAEALAFNLGPPKVQAGDKTYSRTLAEWAVEQGDRPPDTEVPSDTYRWLLSVLKRRAPRSNPDEAKTARHLGRKVIIDYLRDCTEADPPGSFYSRLGRMLGSGGVEAMFERIVVAVEAGAGLTPPHNNNPQSLLDYALKVKSA